MTKPMHTELLNTYTIEIYYDETSECPREWDNIGTMVWFGQKYRQHSFWEDNLHYETFLQDHGEWTADSTNFEDEDCLIPTLESVIWMEKAKSEVVWFPLKYQDDHYNPKLYIEERGNDPEDEPDGAIYVDLKKLKKEFGVTEISPEFREKVEGYLTGEIQTMNDWLSGECYGYQIKDSNGEDMDSCWGFLGDYKYCLEQAIERVKAYD